MKRRKELKKRKAATALVCKRKKFGTIFVQRWLLVVVMLALVYLVGVSFFANSKKNELKREYYWAQGHNIEQFAMLSQKYEGQQLRNWANFALTYMVSTRNCFALLWDPQTGEVIGNCEEKLFLVSKNNEEDELRMLVCDSEDISGWQEYRQKLKREYHISTYLLEQLGGRGVVYSNGDFFVPHEIYAEVTKNNLIENLLTKDYREREVFQTTIKGAENVPEGYEGKHIDEHWNKNFVALGYSPDNPYVIGNRSADDAYELLWDYYEARKTDEKSSAWAERETFFTIKIVSDMDVEWEDERTLSMLSVAYLDVWENYGGILFGIGVVALLAGTLLAFLLAKVSYAHLKAGYDMEDYRRNLMNTMAHDLKSPLMSISGYAENLRDNLHTDKQTYYSEAILNSVQYMNGIIESVLSLSKSENGNVVLKKETLEMGDTLRRLLAVREEWLMESGLTVEITGECELTVDKVLWEQVCSNLLDNAIKYASKNSVIRVMIEKEQISFWNACDEDMGAMADSLCDPFVVGDASRGSRKGSGLGLTIAKNICQLHGFELELVCEEKSFEVKIRV